MKKRPSTETAIEELVSAQCGDNASMRERYLYREALRGLVRLAKSEHVLEIKMDVERLTGSIAARAARRRTKELLLAQRLLAAGEPG